MILPNPTGDSWVKYFHGTTGEQTALLYMAGALIEYWRRKADGHWVQLPVHLWHPKPLAHQPWRPRIH